MEAQEFITVPALNTDTGKVVNLELMRDQLYMITYRDGKVIYGWFSTDPDKMRLIHEKAGLNDGKVELALLEYQWDASTYCFQKVNKVLDLENEIKTVTKVVFFIKYAKKNPIAFKGEVVATYTGEFIQDFNIQYNKPIIIECDYGLKFIGTIVKYKKKGFFRKKEAIILNLIPVRMNPNKMKRKTVTINLDMMRKYTYVDIEVTTKGRGNNENFTY